MIKTIHQIGKEVSANMDAWHDLIETDIKINVKNKNYVLPIIFDLDKDTVLVKPKQLTELDISYPSMRGLFMLRTLGRNMKSPYLTVEGKKVEGMIKAIFSKPDKQGIYPAAGDIVVSIRKDFKDLQESRLVDVLSQLNRLRISFFKIFQEEITEEEEQVSTKLSIVHLEKKLNLGKNEKIVLIYPVVTSTKERLLEKPITELAGYESYIEKRFLTTANSSEDKGNNGLCYLTGLQGSAVQAGEFAGRYNINKFFVQETKNYAQNFEANNFNKNYQLSATAQTYLNRGSDYLLKNMVVSIADNRYVLVPKFLDSQQITNKRLKQIFGKTDLLFNLTQLTQLEDYLEIRTAKEVYWLNFLGIDSDGNYFKVNHQINDISDFHFNRILEVFQEVTEELKPWLGNKYALSFNRFYGWIPVRAQKENVNKALHLFAAILEGRKIDRRIIFKHFNELILCHHYKRYIAFKNIKNYFKDFDFAAKDAVFGYLALFSVLEKLNLIKNQKNMEDKAKITGEEIEKNETAFFERMNFTKAQQSLFHLGKALNSVAYQQSQKGSLKRILNQLNYNGMAKKDIVRLHIALAEKGTQYKVVKNGKQAYLTDVLQYSLNGFSKNFDINNWQMDSNEALYFILAGYTFGIQTTKKES